MPNHIHGIIVLADETVGAGLAPALNRATARVAPTKPTLGNVVGTFKSLSTTTWLDYIDQNNLNIVGKFWHRNYYEHIVRDEGDLSRIREYVAANPFRWDHDRENPSNLLATDAWLADEKIWFSKSNLKSPHD